jgi:hypothetical protein
VVKFTNKFLWAAITLNFGGLFFFKGGTMSRIALSKKTRFEIFKRDSFNCRYCGSGTANGSILNVDHVIPVSKGGTNDMENLVTSCFECNSGKSNRSLNDLKSVKNTVDVKDFKNQVKEYFNFIKQKQSTIDQTVDLILENIGNPKEDFDLKQRQSIRVFLKKISVSELIDYSIIANVKMGSRSSYTKFKYLCGICHNVIKTEVANGSN